MKLEKKILPRARRFELTTDRPSPMVRTSRPMAPASSASRKSLQSTPTPTHKRIAQFQTRISFKRKKPHRETTRNRPAKHPARSTSNRDLKLQTSIDRQTLEIVPTDLKSVPPSCAAVRRNLSSTKFRNGSLPASLHHGAAELTPRSKTRQYGGISDFGVASSGDAAIWFTSCTRLGFHVTIFSSLKRQAALRAPDTVQSSFASRLCTPPFRNRLHDLFQCNGHHCATVL